MRRTSIGTFAAVLLLRLAAEPTAAGELPDELREQVVTAVSRGTKFLKTQQLANGGWAELQGYDLGITSLVTYAMLRSGVKADDPMMKRSLEMIRAEKLNRFDKTYCVALQTMIFCAVDPKRDLELIQRNADWLVGWQLKDVDNGSWSYPGRHGDLCNSAFALRALDAAARAGAKIDPETWERAVTYYRAAQNDDGSWGYQSRQFGTGSMTISSIASFTIAEHWRAAAKQPKEAPDTEAQKAAYAWMADAYTIQHNPRGGYLKTLWHYYYLYNLAETNRLTNTRHVGEHDWYREGAEYLIRHQDLANGQWKGEQHPETNSLIGTSFALLFLSPIPAADDDAKGDADNGIDTPAPKSAK